MRLMNNCPIVELKNSRLPQQSPIRQYALLNPSNYNLKRTPQYDTYPNATKYHYCKDWEPPKFESYCTLKSTHTWVLLDQLLPLPDLIPNVRIYNGPNPDNRTANMNKKSSTPVHPFNPSWHHKPCGSWCERWLGRSKHFNIQHDIIN